MTLPTLAKRALVSLADWALSKVLGPKTPGRPETLEEQRGRRVMSERARAASNGPFTLTPREDRIIEEATSPRAIDPRSTILPPKR